MASLHTVHREGCHAPVLLQDCDCPATGVLLTVDEFRYLHQAASAYDTRIPADGHAPLWLASVEAALLKPSEADDA